MAAARGHVGGCRSVAIRLHQTYRIQDGVTFSANRIEARTYSDHCIFFLQQYVVKVGCHGCTRQGEARPCRCRGREVYTCPEVSIHSQMTRNSPHDKYSWVWLPALARGTEETPQMDSVSKSSNISRVQGCS